VTGPTGPIAVGPTGPFGPQFEPARTLFVAQSWPAGADPLVFFTSIQAAINQAATMTPTDANHVDVIIYPGTYNGNITLVSCVDVVAAGGEGSVQIVGTLTWTPGVGPNAPLTAVTERIAFERIFVTGSFSFDSTGKSATGSVVMHCNASAFAGIIANGRAGDTIEDIMFFYNCVWLTKGANTYVFTNMGQTGVALVGTRFSDMALAGDTLIRVQGGETERAVSTITVRDTARLFLDGLNVFNKLDTTSIINTSGTGDTLTAGAGFVTLFDAAGLFVGRHLAAEITIAGAANPANNGTFTIIERVSATTVRFDNPAGVTENPFLGTWTIQQPSIVAQGCRLNASITVGAGAVIDVRDSDYQSQANLIGPGQINRSTWKGTIVTVAGANVIALDPPFPDTSYNIQLQLTAGPGNASVTVTNKTGSSFTVTDTVGGNTFDYTLTNEA
jgi:hypothetical protein